MQKNVDKFRRIQRNSEYIGWRSSEPKMADLGPHGNTIIFQKKFHQSKSFDHRQSCSKSAETIVDQGKELLTELTMGSDSNFSY